MSILAHARSTPETMKWFLIAVITVVGAALPAQAGVNALLRRFAGHPLWAALANFTVGMLVLAGVALALRVPAPSVAKLGEAPWWAWLGGLSGATVVTAGLIAAPRLGATLLVGCLLAGQLLSSVFLDHFGLLGYPMRAVSTTKVVGVVMLAAGVLLIERG